jgi:hypothetical protein
MVSNYKWIIIFHHLNCLLPYTIGKKTWALFITAERAFQNNAGQKTLKLKKSEMFVR